MRMFKIFIAVCCALAMSLPTLADELDLDLLKALLRMHQANQEQIVTWSGQVRVEAHKVRPDDSGYHMVSNVTFVQDKSQGKRWRWDVVLNETIQGGVFSPRGPESLETHDEMVRDDGYFRYEKGFLPAGESEWQRTMVVWPKEEAVARVAMTSRSFDPDWYFTTEGRSIPQMLQLMIDDPAFAEGVTVTRDGALVTIENRGENIDSRYQFDLSKGGNLTEYVVSRGASTWEIAMEYTQQGDVWVPSRYHKTTNTPRTGEHTREVVWTSQEINEPVPASEFTMEAMGILPRARVTDHRVGVFYEYLNESNSVRTDTSRRDAARSAQATDASPTPALQPSDGADISGNVVAPAQSFTPEPESVSTKTILLVVFIVVGVISVVVLVIDYMQRGKQINA